MGMVILTILKIIGISLLVILGLILLLLFLVLFVPIRYRVDLKKDAEGEQQIHALVKVTWLLHLLNVSFRYPEEAYLKVRIACFTLFRSDQEKEPKAAPSKKQQQKKEQQKQESQFQAENTSQQTTQTAESTSGPTEDMLLTAQEEHEEIPLPQEEVFPEEMSMEAEQEKEAEENRKWKLLFQKIEWMIGKIRQILGNIRYTIQSVYDKIMNIIHHIRYYYKVVRSDLFHRTWEKCSKEALKLLKSIAPRRIKGYLHIGMEDPATTGQILAYYGMLYPLIGGHIDVVPDFDRVVLEGQLKIRGHITLFCAVKTACTVYFNKDLRKLIRLLKREVT